jgi:hypothetical protein
MFYSNWIGRLDLHLCAVERIGGRVQGGVPPKGKVEVDEKREQDGGAGERLKNCHGNAKAKFH